MTDTPEDLDKQIEDLELNNKVTPESLKDLAIHILQKSKNVRTPKDLDILEYYTSNIEFFKKLRDENEHGQTTHVELCRNLDYEFLEPDKVLFAAGSIGNKFYIILEGKVDVEINIVTKDLSGVEHYISKKVGEIPSGKSFGELAIMEDSLKPRKATIISRLPCHFATLTRNDFRATLGHIKKEQEAQIELFSSNPLFNKMIWSNRTLNLLMRSFQVQSNVRRNSFLYKEGDTSENIYFLISGDVVSTKTVVIPNPENFQKDVIFDEEDKLYQIDRAAFVKKIEISYFRPGHLFGEEETLDAYIQELTVEKERDRLRKEFKRLFEEERKRKAKEGFRFRPDGIVELPKFENDDPKAIEQHTERQLLRLFPNNFPRITSVMVTSSKADLLVISKRNFFTQVTGNPKAYQILKEMMESKRERRLARLTEIQRSSANNLEFLSKHTVSQLNSDIKSLVFKRKAEKQKRTIEILEHRNESMESVHDTINFIDQTQEVRYQYEKIPKVMYPMSTSKLFTLHDKFIKKNTLLPGVAERMKKLIKENENKSRSPQKADQIPVRHERSMSYNPSPISSIQRRESQEMIVTNSQNPSPSPQTRHEARRNLNISPNVSVASVRGSTSTGPYYIENSFIKRAKDEKQKKYQDKKALLRIRNPTVGMSYLTNLDYEENIRRNQILNSENRITNKPKPSEIMDPEIYTKRRVETKMKVINDLQKGSSPDTRFFTIKELNESRKETYEQLKIATKLGLSHVNTNEPGTSRSLPQSPQSTYRNPRSGQVSPRSPSPRSPSPREVTDFEPYLPKGYRSHIMESNSTNQSPKLRYKSTQKSSLTRKSNQNSNSFLPIPIPKNTDDSMSVIRTGNRENESYLLKKIEKNTILKTMLKKIINPKPKEKETPIQAEEKPLHRPFMNQSVNRFLSQNTSMTPDMSVADMARDQSNFVANFLSEKKEFPQIPGLVLHNRKLSVRDNTIYNRGLSVDKAKILAERNSPRFYLHNTRLNRSQVGI